MARLNINTIDLDSIDEISRFEKIKPKFVNSSNPNEENKKSKELKLSYKQKNDNNIMDNFSF